MRSSVLMRSLSAGLPNRWLSAVSASFAATSCNRVSRSKVSKSSKLACATRALPPQASLPQCAETNGCGLQKAWAEEMNPNASVAKLPIADVWPWKVLLFAAGRDQDLEVHRQTSNSMVLQALKVSTPVLLTLQLAHLSQQMPIPVYSMHSCEHGQKRTRWSARRSLGRLEVC